MFIATPTAPINAGNSGFDTHCNNSTNIPSSTTVYKALVSDGTKRRVCSNANCSGETSEHIHWSH
ncbi:DUF1554 domain-containing protein [Leptospira mtsangambouensis]|uniref:DUF1554 domain-containing protein n=1 Tax=Leptospira mtsangambouensis TaxID=2484912 RepID=A0ABY2NXV3_9LEPT|nr:DUF1554 domain-containing protein [Leptospira mtsangambouensis]